ncbi:MAG TPA: MBL fold metallo-hydrolase [Burkholderiaceae bacterium]
MNPAEHELHYLRRDWPAPGTAAEVAAGLFWVRMPLPFALDHVNLWLFDDRIDGTRGWTLVDCGAATDATRAAWETLFDALFDGRPLLRVIATHFHPDHLGNAHWLGTGGVHGRWHAPLWMTAAEYSTGRLLTTRALRSDTGDGDGVAEFYRIHGVSPEHTAERVRARGLNYYTRLVPSVPPTYYRLIEGDSITIGAGPGPQRCFRVLIGHGHAPEHALLACEDERILISGDMVLPRISTNVSVYEVEPDADPLARYLDSIDRLRALPQDMLVLPSHGLPFTGLHRRIEQQHEHHRARLEEVLAACEAPRTAAEIVPVLFRRTLDAHQASFAFGESLAHLHALWHQGRLERERDADGVFRFRRR